MVSVLFMQIIEYTFSSPVVAIVSHIRVKSHIAVNYVTQARSWEFSHFILTLPLSASHTHSFPGQGPVCYCKPLIGVRLGWDWDSHRCRQCQNDPPLRSICSKCECGTINSMWIILCKYKRGCEAGLVRR